MRQGYHQESPLIIAVPSHRYLPSLARTRDAAPPASLAAALFPAPGGECATADDLSIVRHGQFGTFS